MARRDSGPGLHAHGCTRCRARYEDTCEAEDENGLCMFCRVGKRWELLYQNRLPKDCCRISSRVASKEERKTYRLGGPKDFEWHKCTMCCRTHPFNPANH